MPVKRLLTFVLLGIGLVSARETAAQPLGTYRWQLTPFCNVLTLAVTQVGGQYRLEGYDDQCGTAQRAPVTGLVVPNPDGTLEFGLTVVHAPGAVPAHIDVTFTIATLGGTWRDSAGNVGTLVFDPASVSGSPRPGGIGASAINPEQVQRRIAGACGAATFVQSINADGTVNCGSDVVGSGDITSVTAGAGLSGGGTAGAVSLGVSFAGPGSAASAARSDHTHEQGYLSTGVGQEALGGAAQFSTAVGYRALRTNGGFSNTALGTSVLGYNTADGIGNTGVGHDALGSNQTGDNNTALGAHALKGTVSANGNTAIGHQALRQTRGSSNLALGAGAGNLHEAGSNNIYIDHPGVASESSTTRIGESQSAAYVAGIYGRAASSGVSVYVNSLGKLGTANSSRRFKERIASLDDVSAKVQALRPVTFVYKPEFDDGSRVKQYGLIAEEVDEVLPDLVVRDAQGQPETVRYHFLNVLLLAEVQRLERRLAQQTREIEELRALINQSRDR
jgi:hypothetical protein